VTYCLLIVIEIHLLFPLCDAAVRNQQIKWICRVHRSAFFCFCNDERPKVKAAHPNYTVGEIAKELGRRWETCSNKSKYEALAAKDKARYEQVSPAAVLYDNFHI